MNGYKYYGSTVHVAVAGTALYSETLDQSIINHGYGGGSPPVWGQFPPVRHKRCEYCKSNNDNHYATCTQCGAPLP